MSSEPIKVTVCIDGKPANVAYTVERRIVMNRCLRINLDGPHTMLALRDLLQEAAIKAGSFENVHLCVSDMVLSFLSEDNGVRDIYKVIYGTRSLTAEDVLDFLIQTFPGVKFYRDAPRPNSFFLNAVVKSGIGLTECHVQYCASPQYVTVRGETHLIPKDE